MDSHMTKPGWTRSPETRRWIKIGGPTYMRLGLHVHDKKKTSRKGNGRFGYEAPYTSIHARVHDSGAGTNAGTNAGATTVVRQASYPSKALDRRPSHVRGDEKGTEEIKEIKEEQTRPVARVAPRRGRERSPEETNRIAIHSGRKWLQQARTKSEERKARSEKKSEESKHVTKPVTTKPSEAKREGKDDYTFLEVGNDSKSPTYQWLERLLPLPENRALPEQGWDPHFKEFLPTNADQPLFVFLDGDTLVGYFETTAEARTHTVHLDIVHLHPRYAGRKLCKPFLKRVIQHFLDLGYTHLHISNMSGTQDGIPACLCYYRAAKEQRLQISYWSKGKYSPLPDESQCLSKTTNQMDLLFTI